MLIFFFFLFFLFSFLFFFSSSAFILLLLHFFFFFKFMQIILHRACNAGFFVSAAAPETCTACNFGSFYEPVSHHRPSSLSGCQYTCLAGIYIDRPALLCNQKCTDLLAEASAERLRPRVRDMPSGPRPHYIHGVCGNDEEIAPRAEVRFLRLGRWAYLSKQVATIASECGNSLLNDAEVRFDLLRFFCVSVCDMLHSALSFFFFFLVAHGESGVRRWQPCSGRWVQPRMQSRVRLYGLLGV